MFSDQTPLLGAPSATADQVIAYMLARPHGGYTDDQIRDVIVPAYFRVCTPVGLDPVLVIAQMIHETGNLTSFWSARPQCNPAGIGVNGDSSRKPPSARERSAWSYNTQRKAWERGLSFATWEKDAVIAHVGRLLAYALAPGQATEAQHALIKQALAYRPLPTVMWGSAPRLRQLGKRHNHTGSGWASPGDHYGATIAAIASAIAATSTPTVLGALTPAAENDELLGSGEALPALAMLDVRSRLPRKSWSIGKLDHPTHITLHYNGPPVANRSREGELAQLVSDARWQMRPGALGADDGGDGLQYHFVVLSDGTICQARDLDAKLWHCGSPEGNSVSLSVHLPLGGDQDATPPQWEATTRLCDALIASFGMAGRRCVWGHQEWKEKDCPGPQLMRRLRLWREGDRPAPARQYRVRFEEANVRQGPGVGYPVVLVVKPGELVIPDCVVSGQSIKGDDRWLHRADGLGFMHISVVEPLEEEEPVLGGAAGVEAPLRFVVVFDQLHVRAEPSVEAAVVATLCQDQQVYAQALVLGQPLGDSPYWAALVEPRGFVHERLLRLVETL